MTPLVTIFSISGLSLLLLLTAKRLEEKRKRPFFIFSLISKGDARMRRVYQRLIHVYFDSKENFLFFLEKQLPIHSRNSKNKILSYLKEKRAQYVNNMRDARLLKKSDGISEFFKSISNIEKGNGEIHDTIENARQNDSVGLGSQEGEKEVM